VRNIFRVFVLAFSFQLSFAGGSAWDFALSNQIGKALRIAVDSNNAANWLNRALFHTALGQDSAAEFAILKSYAISKNPDDLMLHFNTLLRPMREQDSIPMQKLRGILRQLEISHPGHPLRLELAAELLPSRIGMVSSDSLRGEMDALGLVRNWNWIGPFENISNSGSLHALAPELGNGKGAPLPGKSGLQVNWRAYQNRSLDGWIRISEIVGLPDAVNYFASEVLSDGDRSAILNFGASGTFTVWVNGMRILDEAQFRNLGVTGIRARVHLRKGANQIVVKIGHEGSPRSNFIVILGDSLGIPLRLVSKPSVIPKALAQGVIDSSRLIVPSWVAHTGVGEWERQVRLANYWIQNDGFEQARPILAKLAKQFPQSGWVASLRAEIFAREEKYALADQYYQESGHLDSTLANAWSYEFQKRIGREDWAGAIQVFESRPGTLKLIPQQIFSAIKSYLSTSRDVEAWAWVDTLVIGYPNTPDAWIYASGVHAAIGDKKLSVELLKRSGKKLMSMPGVMNELVDRYRSLGTPEEAVKILKAKLALFPEQVDEWKSLAEIFFENKQWNEVIVAADSGLRLNPFLSKLWIQKARAHEMRATPGDAEFAAVAYSRALELPGTDFDIGARVQDLRQEPLLKDLQGKWSIDSLVGEGVSWKEAQGQPSLILLSQRALRWYSWGGVEQAYRLIVDVRNAKGVDQWKEQNAADHFFSGDVEVERAVTHKADGRVLDADVYGNKVVFQGLEPGDHLELEAVSRERKDGALTGNFWATQYMGSSVPMLHSVFEVFAEERASQRIRVAFSGKSVSEKPSKVNGLVRQAWRADRIVGRPGEQGMSDWGDVLPKVVISTVKDWQTFSTWYSELSDGKAKASPELRELADSLFAGAQSDEEKVQRAHNYIVWNIRYSHQSFRQSGFIPQDATKTWLTRIGDCKDMATLGKALLKLGGVESELVLVNTNDQERKALLPMDVFNHCILWVPLGKGRYIDFTADQNGYQALPRSDQLALSLRLTGTGKDSAVSIPFDVEGERMVRESQDTLFADGSLIRDMQTVRGGNFAAAFRQDYRQELPSRIKDLSLLALQDGYPGVDLFELDARNLDSLQQDLRYRSHFRIRRYASLTDNAISLVFPWSDPISPGELPGEGTRVYPWVAWKGWKFWGTHQQSIQMLLPAGFKPLVVPRDLQIEGRFGFYSVSFKIRDRILEAHRNWEPKQFEVSPQDYPALRRELEALIQADQQVLVLSRP
jgi:tetratricopeptide (TPR) repeat protein